MSTIDTTPEPQVRITPLHDGITIAWVASAHGLAVGSTFSAQAACDELRRQLAQRPA